MEGASNLDILWARFSAGADRSVRKISIFVAMKKLNGQIWLIIPILGIVLMVMAIRRNPTDAIQKLELMRHDMSVALSNGGVLIIGSRNSKYGSAYLYNGIDAKTWTSSLADKYDQAFLSLGWKRISYEGEEILCKERIVAKVHRNLEHGEGKSFYGINMTYNALTIQRCGRS